MFVVSAAELVVSSGGSRRGSADADAVDSSSSGGDSSNGAAPMFPGGIDPSKTPTRGRPFKVFQNSPKKREFGSK